MPSAIIVGLQRGDKKIAGRHDHGNDNWVDVSLYPLGTGHKKMARCVLQTACLNWTLLKKMGILTKVGQKMRLQYIVYFGALYFSLC